MQCHAYRANGLRCPAPAQAHWLRLGPAEDAVVLCLELCAVCRAAVAGALDGEGVRDG